jgi:hypothetical protein
VLASSPGGLLALLAASHQREAQLKQSMKYG